MMSSHDALLVAGVQAGDENAFTTIVDRYQGVIGRYLLRLTGDPTLAEELCQETFFRAYRALFKMNDDPSGGASGQSLALKPWLYRIATNTAYSVLRRRRPQTVAPERLDGLAQPASYLERQAAQRDLVQRTLAQLSPDYAVPLVLSAVEGFDYREIAAILGLSAEATRKRIYRAKQQFRAAYEK